MKKILFITNSLIGGGAEKVITTLAYEMNQMGYYVHLIILNPIIETQLDFELPIDILMYKKKSLTNSKRLANIVNSIESRLGIFDIVLSNLPETDYLVKQIKHENTFYVIHTTFYKAYINNKGFFKRIRRLLKYRKLYNNENIITVSDGAQLDFLQNMKIRPKSIQTIQNPINFDMVTKRSQDLNVQIPAENYILHIGNYGTVKRHDILLKSFKLSGLECRLVLIGSNVESHMKQLVMDLNLEKQVIFMGFVANPYPIIKNAKLLVVSSEFEGFPMVIPEALALGCEVVSTNCESGPREILTGKLAENLVKVNDIPQMSEKIKEVYLRNQENIINDFTGYIKHLDSRTIASKYTELLT